MAPLVRRPDAPLHDLLDEAGGAVQRAAALLREILVDPPANEDVARELLRCEQAADRITHDIIHRLNGGAPRGARRRAIIRADDGHQLATARAPCRRCAAASTKRRGSSRSTGWRTKATA
jgi:hypothetical protein